MRRNTEVFSGANAIQSEMLFSSVFLFLALPVVLHLLSFFFYNDAKVLLVDTKLGMCFERTTSCSLFSCHANMKNSDMLWIYSSYFPTSCFYLSSGGTGKAALNKGTFCCLFVLKFQSFFVRACV